MDCGESSAYRAPCTIPPNFGHISLALLYDGSSGAGMLGSFIVSDLNGMRASFVSLFYVFFQASLELQGRAFFVWEPVIVFATISSSHS